MHFQRFIAAAATLLVWPESARSDELSQLKAQLESLNIDISRLESSESQRFMYGWGDTSMVPASGSATAASIKWQGYVRAIVGEVGTHEGFDGDQAHGLHSSANGVAIRGQLEAIAKTNTSVGEIGTSFKFRSDYEPWSQSYNILPADLRLKEGFGWWSPDKHWTLGAGYTRSLGNMDFGLDNDGSCTCYFTNNGTASDLRQDDAAQIRLTRSDGRFSSAISIQSATPQDKNGTLFSAQAQQIAFASSTQWNGKSFDAGITTYFAPLRQPDFHAKSEYQIGAGFDADLTKFLNVSVGAAMGRENIVTDCNGGDFESTRYLAVSGLLTVKLNDRWRVEAGYARKYYKQSCHTYKPAQDVAGGVYYHPSREVTLGVEGEWIPFNGGPTDLFIPGPSHDETRVAFVSKFRF